MHRLLANSLILRWLTIAAAWIDRQWEKSFLACYLTGVPRKGHQFSIFSTFSAALHRGLCTVFRTLHLDKILAGSVFTRCFFWCGLTVFLAPIMPTMVVLGMALLGTLSVFLQVGCNETVKLAYSPINRWIMLHLLIYVICTFTSVSLMGSLKSGAVVIVFMLFSIVLQRAVTTRKQVNTIIYLIVGAGFLVSLYGMFQVVTGVQSTESWVDASFTFLSLRVYSTLDNPNVLSEFLLLAIPLGVASLFTAKSKNGKAAALLATGAMLICMILTYSRGGWLGLIVAAAIFLVLLDRRFIVIGVIAFVALIFIMPDTIMSRFTSISNLSDSSTSYRIHIWFGTIDMLKDYWFCGLGTGISAFGAVYPFYSYNAVSAQHSHNLFLQLICECGILGLLSFFAIILSFVRSLGATLKRTTDRTTRLQSIALLSGMTGFLFQGLTDYAFYNYRVTLIFWIIISLGALISRNWKEGAPS